jgi:hypothetical protein
MSFQKLKNVWRDGTLQSWQSALLPVERASPLTLEGAFELVGTEVVENKIIASRLALAVMEKDASAVNDLRKRLKSLNQDHDLAANDIVHPESLALPLVEQWFASGFTRDEWLLVSDAIQRHLTEQWQHAYTNSNTLLVGQGVLPVIEFGARVIQSPSVRQSRNDSAGGANDEPATGSQAPDLQRRGADQRAYESAGSNPAAGAYAAAPAQAQYHAPRARGGRMQGVIEQVGRMLSGATMQQHFAETSYKPPSGALLAAMAHQPRLGEVYYAQSNASMASVAPVVVERVANELRQQSAELKNQAQTDNEKAIIEMVALMFQSILQEDRIPTGVRVWFARLQMPVLRVALAEPDFFSSLDHPARQLIDHMGSCVMGFDASNINGTSLETEIKRVVQVIEQYPDTGERVYRRVYEEFQEFLKQHLTQKPSTQKLMGVAEQVEQKETLTIQYTIELRNLLKDMPVRDEVREFLFRVWAEVLAVAAVRQGPQHQETLLLKKSASDLIWAASAKPNRSDRARVIADLPVLLQCLRTGMSLLGLVKSAQEAHIKIISDILADAFMSKTQAIADDQIQALAERLAHLEDYVSDDGTEELPLDSDSIEELLGIDASELDVITNGGGSASPVMMEWARDLDLGAWFKLDHNNQFSQVQYVWRSPMGHLHLFASTLGRACLIQTARLAAYLQAGLIEPQEDEPLTVRATRDALGKLEANPERLLA